MFRSCLFWTHLGCGIAAGIVVLTMSVTGVLLTYERQLEHWFESFDYVPVQAQTEAVPLAQLLVTQQQERPDLQVSTLILSKDPGAPVELRAGRSGSLTLNPYTGQQMQVGSESLGNFFGFVTRFHRWFNIEGEQRTVARQVTGVSNIVFLFLILSGLYLWLPKIKLWPFFKSRLLLRRKYPNAKARDFHWHHIFGMWMALPLLAVVYCGAVISYPWAANLLYTAFGAPVPESSGPRRPPAPPQTPAQALPQSAIAVASLEQWQTLEQLIDTALQHSGAGWQRVNVSLPAPEDSSVSIEIDTGNGAQAHKRHTLTLDRSGGEVLSVTEFSDTPKAQRLRGIARFLHTGEVLGWWGQTLAGLASLAAVFLVWTGFALAWRRLIQPYLRR